MNHPKPSLGRTVFYTDANGAGPFAATIAHVHTDDIRVNLAVIDEDGNGFPASYVPFDIENARKPHSWYWPPRLV